MGNRIAENSSGNCSLATGTLIRAGTFIRVRRVVALQRFVVVVVVTRLSLCKQHEFFSKRTESWKKKSYSTAPNKRTGAITEFFGKTLIDVL